MPYKHILHAAAVSLAALPSIAAANAQPLSSPATFVQPNSDVVHVQYREPYGYYGERDDDEGIVDLPGEAVSGPTGVGDCDDGQGMAACARRFSSFDPGSGTYVTYSGGACDVPLSAGLTFSTLKPPAVSAAFFSLPQPDGPNRSVLISIGSWPRSTRFSLIASTRELEPQTKICGMTSGPYPASINIGLSMRRLGPVQSERWSRVRVVVTFSEGLHSANASNSAR
jgi:hypothetical protein